MHTYKAKNGTTFHFNSDFSGEIIISFQEEEIEVPADDILMLVATFLSSARVSKIESMDYKEILGID